MTDEAQWFSPLGKCRKCGKDATGTVMGRHNQPMGAYCRLCGEKRISAAVAERDTGK